MNEQQRAVIKLRLTLFSVENGQIVDQALLAGRGGFFTGASRVEQLLTAPLNEYVKGIFR